MGPIVENCSYACQKACHRQKFTNLVHNELNLRIFAVGMKKIILKGKILGVQRKIAQTLKICKIY